MEDLILLCWNVRGACSEVNKRNIKDLVMANKANLVCIQETKNQGWSDALMNSVWDIDTHGWEAQNAEGFSGGLITSWDNLICRHVSSVKNRNWIWSTFEVLSSNERFHCVNVYASQELKEKKVLWEELKQIYSNCEQDPVCFAGDFNCIRSSEGRD